jgi:hypothetical protein
MISGKSGADGFKLLRIGALAISMLPPRPHYPAGPRRQYLPFYRYKYGKTA